MPQQVGYEDIVKVEGTAQTMVGKIQSKEAAVEKKRSMVIPVQSASVSFLSTWAPSDKPEREVNENHEFLPSRCTPLNLLQNKWKAFFILSSPKHCNSKNINRM